MQRFIILSLIQVVARRIDGTGSDCIALVGDGGTVLHPLSLKVLHESSSGVAAPNSQYSQRSFFEDNRLRVSGKPTYGSPHLGILKCEIMQRQIRRLSAMSTFARTSWP
jgi:hypothetical protein